VFGIMEGLLSFIRRQVGLRTDAASASGSLHAKIKQTNEDIATIKGKNIIANGSAVKSVQRGFIVPSNLQEVDVTISSVNTSKSIVIITTIPPIQDAAGSTNCYLTVYLKNSTTISMPQCSNLISAPYIAWQIIEFY